VAGEEVAEILLDVFHEACRERVYQGDDQDPEGNGSPKEKASLLLAAEISKGNAQAVHPHFPYST
jgi:hypothetical protein